MNNEAKIEGLITEQLLSGNINKFILGLKTLEVTPEEASNMELFGDKKLGENVAKVLTALKNNKSYDKEVKELSDYTKSIATSFSEPQSRIDGVNEQSQMDKANAFVTQNAFNNHMTDFTAAINKMSDQIKALVEDVNQVKNKVNFSSNADFAVNSDSDAFKKGVELGNSAPDTPEDKLNDKAIENGFKSEDDINNFKFGFNSVAKKAPDIGSGESKVEGGEGKTEADKAKEEKKTDEHSLFSVLSNMTDALEGLGARVACLEQNFSDNVSTGEAEVVDGKVKVDPVAEDDVEDISLSEDEFSEYFAEAEEVSAIPEAVKEIKESDATNKQKLIATEFLKSEGVAEGVKKLEDAGVPEKKIEEKFVEKAAEIAEIKPEALEKKLDASETFSTINNITQVLEAFSERLGAIEYALFSEEGEVATGESETVDGDIKVDPVAEEDPEKLAMSDTDPEPAPQIVETKEDGPRPEGSEAAKEAEKIEEKIENQPVSNAINHAEGDEPKDEEKKEEPKAEEKPAEEKKDKSKAWYDGMNSASSDPDAKKEGRAAELAKKFGYEDGSNEYNDFIDGFKSGIPSKEAKEENHSAKDFEPMSSQNFSDSGNRYEALNAYLKNE